MARIYSIEFFCGVVDNTDPVVLNVPAGHVYVLRDMQARTEGDGNTHAPGVRFASFGEPGTWFLSFTRALLPPWSPGATWSWEGRQVFTPGQILRAHPISAAGLYTLRCCGYDLQAP